MVHKLGRFLAGAVRRLPVSRAATVPWSSSDFVADVRDVLVGGRRVRYVDVGAGPTILLIHGLGGSWQHWAANLGALRDAGYRVVAIDLPGFGHSDPLPLLAGMAEQVGTVAALLDQVQAAEVTVVGHSMGALIAMHLAYRDPRVEALVLTSGGGVGMSMKRLDLIVGASNAIILAAGLPGAGRLFLGGGPLRDVVLRTFIADPGAVPRDYLRQLVPGVRAPGLSGAVRAAARAVGDVDAADIAVPALVVWGDADRVLTPGHGRRLAEALPNGRLAVAPGVGHCPMFEAPRWFNQAVTRFLEDVRQAGDQGRHAA